MDIELFRDRLDAGSRLSKRIHEFRDRDTLVLAIPKGGVPVGCEVAKHLNSRLDIILPRRIPIPWNPETSMGAMTTDGIMVLNNDLIRGLDISEGEIEQAADNVRIEIERQTHEYRGDHEPADMRNKTIIIVDDGLASGYTMLAAVESVRTHNPSEIVVAVPVASKAAIKLIRPKTDHLIVLIQGESLPFAVSDYYGIWHNLTDANITNCLNDLAGT
jgi:putative phosphoribosyl transferase